MAGAMSGWALIWTSLTWWLVFPLLALFIVSLLDDVYGLPVRIRLPVHIVAAALLVVGSGLLENHNVLFAMAALLLTAWLTNLYNFMDGSNGMAGGMALFGFGMYGIAALSSHNDMLAMQNFAISAAALGFLFYNFPKARIFLGDAGSIPLGYLAAAMGLCGWLQGSWSAWFPLLVFSPFIVDASVTLAKRIMRGAKITEAHREHYYQRTIQMGMSHRNVALVEYALMLGSGASAMLVQTSAFPWQTLLIWGGIYGTLMLSLDAAWKRFERRLHA